MHTTPSEAAQLAQALRQELLAEPRGIGPDVQVVVCPPFTNLEAVRRVLQGSGILWGAQNCHEEVQGAYTGEISARMLSELGCTVVLVGHSERRRYAGESDQQIARKLRRVVEFGMYPVLCIGETLEEREKGMTGQVLEQQLGRGLEDFPSGAWKQLLVAYEPVWAIGTGVAAQPEYIAEAHTLVRRLLERLGAPEDVPILYGGSVHSANIRAIVAQREVSGVLVGGASLEASHFRMIVQAVADAVWC